MITGTKRYVCVLLSMISVLAVPAQAATCWKERHVAAAKVRDLETMLMVSALRCRLSGQDFLADYNGFIRQSRSALVDVNERLRAHFQEAVGAAGALDAYDRYVTSIANGYGAGVTGLGCVDMQSILKAASANGYSVAGLEEIAERTGAQPHLPGGQCPLQIARAP